jgi:hypothetical protein
MVRLKLLILVITVLFLTGDVNASDIWVAVNGSDKGAGTKESPMATIAMALRKARELRRLKDPSINGGIHIKIKMGRYQFYEPLFIRPEDSGTVDSPTLIENADGEVVFSGGIKIDNWKKLKSTVAGLPSSSLNKVWVADVPLVGGRPLEFRQLWVNDNKAIRARDRNGDSMNRILTWDHENESCVIPKPQSPSLSSAEGIEMVIHQWWAIAILRVRSINVNGNNATLTFHQPESRVQSEHPWPAPWISKKTGNSAFYLMNAIQFLDQPGEWFLDVKNSKLYYYPRANEKMETANVIAPSIETLVKMEGTVDRPVSNVFFKGISFQHTGWLRPSLSGHVPHQAGMYMLDAYKLKVPGTVDKKGLENQAWVGRPAASVEVSYANHTGFENCVFIHHASTGLDYKRGTHDNEIKGNLFKDIGGSGILAGVFSDEATEVHLPYKPIDSREVSTNDHISDNMITDVANEDWGCVGIGAGYVKNIRIDHNEICNVSYTGISMGWGWTKTENVMRDNVIAYNHIHHYAKHMYDVAAIYTLSSQPGTEIKNNYIDSIYKAPYAHDPNHWFYLYTDEGSSYITVKDNWCPAEKFLQNANGPGNEWSNNGPQVSSSVKNNAGIRPAYSYLWSKRTIDNNWKINAANEPEHSKRDQFLTEIILPKGVRIDPAALKNVLLKNKIPVGDAYQWNEHIVIYDTVAPSLKTRNEIAGVYPGAEVKTYKDVVYEFTRERCDQKKAAGEWEHILLTANLVKDESLQKEYVEYHRTQYEKWPEVAKGFCNADFQQLVVMRNKRQLMLVISIPKGKTLDELNPKTTENNPRVDEWNAIMKKYQEGIEGTAPGEVWVFLKPLFDK